MKTFLDIKQPPYEDSRAVIIPFGYEKAVSYLMGTSRGPGAIMEASSQLELYDIQTDSEPHLMGIHTLSETEIEGLSPEKAQDFIYDAVQKTLNDGKLPVLLGGEHSISAGSVRACKEKFPDLTVLQIDAHADLRDSYEGSKYSHACAMSRIAESAPYVGVGIRSVGTEELDAFKKKRTAGEIITVDDFRRLNNFKSIIDKLTENIYITIDADGYDPSIIPGVGTPEPGGLTYQETDNLLSEVITNRNVVGFDFMELRPITGEVRSEFTAAKIIYKIIARIFRKNN